jgi:hypothetical protein
MVGECFVGLWRCFVRDVGGIRSVNVDMSSDKGGEKFFCWKFKVFCVMFIGVGWVGF